MAIEINTSAGNTIEVTQSDGTSVTFNQETSSVSVSSPASTSVQVLEKGVKGDKGDTGDTGPQGEVGPGVASGGTENQFIQKNSATDYDTKWSAYTLPAADGDDGQVLTTNGAATVTFAYPKTIAEDVKNVSGGPLVKGTPVHVTGSVGNLAEVIAADAATNYPAHFVLNEDLADDQEGLGIAIGFINNVDVPDASIYTEGQTVYLGAAGGWTTTKPTGANAIQNLGIIIKVNVTGGGPSGKISGIIMGAGRANDVPNIATGNIWAGNADGVATATSVAYIDIANSKVGIGTTSPVTPLHIKQDDSDTGIGAGLTIEQLGLGDATIQFLLTGQRRWVAGIDNSDSDKFKISSTASLGSGDNFVIDTSNNVGIGTSSPSRRLQVKGTENTAIAVTSATTSYVQLALGDTDDDNYAQIILDNPTNKLQIQNGGGGVVSDRGITLDSSENVGIGTASPTSTLEVSNTTAPTLTLRNPNPNPANAGTIKFIESTNTDGFKLTYDGSDNKLKLISDSSGVETTRMVVQRSDGNVGIGTTSPSQKLDVDGNIQILDTDASNGSVFGYLNFHSTSGGSSGNHARIAAIRDTNAEGQLAFYTKSGGAPSEKMRINSSGNVGIGTSSPNAKLDVAGSIRSSLGGSWASSAGGVQITYDGVDTGTMSMYYDAQDLVLGAGVTNKNGITISGTGADNKISMKAGGSDRVTVLGSSGNVGIGTASPSDKLQVNGTFRSNAFWTNSSAVSHWGNGSTAYGGLTWDTGYATVYSTTGNVLRLGANGASPDVTIDTSGNVGIGTTTPSEKLHVAGSVNIEDDLVFGVGGFLGTSSSIFTMYSLGDIVYNSDSNNNGTSNHIFKESGNELMRIDSSGKVGIGTTTPSAKLDVVGLVNINDGSNNVMISSRNTALTTGTNNTAVGDVAGFINASGNNNSFFGRSAGYYSTGYNNVLLGMEAGRGDATSTFSNTTAVGYQALYGLTTGVNNTSVGYQAGRSNTSGSYNSFVGVYAGNNNTIGDSNSFFGVSAGANNTSGANNAFVGRNAGYNNTTGASNSFFGKDAGYSTTSGGSNSFVGVSAGRSNTTGTNNAFFGVSAGFSNTSGGSNSFFGRDAGYNNTTGASNSFVGLYAGLNNTIGDSNSFVGRSAGVNNTSGANNAFFGMSAGYSNSTGSGNIFLGYQAGYNETGSNKLYIANSNTSTPLIYGDFNLGEITINGDLNVSGGNLRADAVEINGRALTAPSVGEYGAGSRLVTQFASGTVTAGKVYVANAGSWAEGDANAGSTSIGMIAVATDSASANSMLIEGVIKLSSNTGFSGAAAGTVLYLSTTAGELTTTAPSTAGEYVRVCGYVVNASTNEVFFSASRDWTAL